MCNNAPTLQPKLNWRRWLVLILIAVVVPYALVVIPIMLFQRRLIYIPAKLTSDEAEKAAAQRGFFPWRDQSGKIIGWKMSASSAPTGSILIVHGNAGWALNRVYLAEPIHTATSLDVYILEYPGFGAREGSPGEKSFLSAADEAFENLPTNFPVYIVSESLGTGVAAHLAQKNPLKVAGLVLFVPYDKLVSVAQNHMPFFPAYFLLWDRFDPADWLKNYRGPIKFVIAGADQVIPPKFGLRLFDAYKGPKTLQVIAGAGHNDAAEQSSAWWRDVLAFWQQHAQTNNVKLP
jgi:pimeloyl-ACP methyl ester carboxylesterase